MGVGTSSHSNPPPSPGRILRQLEAYRGAAALNSAIELDLFTRIAHGRDTAGKLAAELGIPFHGVECLCDFLIQEGYLFRQGDRFSLPDDVGCYLDRTAPGFLSAVMEDVYSPPLLKSFQNLTECLRKGGAENGRGPSGIDAPLAHAFANAIELPHGVPLKILDLAAGRGYAGVALATRYPEAVVVISDKAEAIRSAQVHANTAKLGTRYQNVPGDPDNALVGRRYDAVILAAELYHRTPPQISSLLKKGRDALKSGGTLFLFEILSDGSEDFVRDSVNDRLLLLTTAKRGYFYSVSDITGMLDACGFHNIESRRLPGTVGTLITAAPPAE